MAVTVVLSGTPQNITATNGSTSISLTSTTNWVVGATVQGSGLAVGTKIVSFVANTSAVLSSAYTGVTGTVSVVVSSNNGTITLQLSASGDIASPTTILSAGFGALDSPASMQLHGGARLVLQIADGATFDDTGWTITFGSAGGIRCDEGYGTGTWRKGYRLIGSVYVKSFGGSYRTTNALNAPGGANVFFSSAAPPSYPAKKMRLHWNEVSFFSLPGTPGNRTLYPAPVYAAFDAGLVTLDATNDGGSNSQFGGQGTLETIELINTLAGLNAPIAGASLVSMGRLYVAPLLLTAPEVRFTFPTNTPVSGFSPVFTSATPLTAQIGCNTSGNELVDDYALPDTYPIAANSRNFSNGTRTYRRTRTIQIFDGVSQARITNATYYLTSGATVLENSVQNQLLSKPIATIFLSWAGRVPTGGAYIAPLSVTDTSVQTLQVRKYGYAEQIVVDDLTNATANKVLYSAPESALSAVSDAAAAALTSIGINWSTKTITPTASLTLDQLNARLAWELCQTANSAQADPRSINGASLTLAAGWTLVVGAGITLSPGAALTTVAVPTITNDGAITGIYTSGTGTSALLQLTGLIAGSAVYVADGSGAQRAYVASSGASYSLSIAPGASGTWTYRVAGYGRQLVNGSFAPGAGGVFSATLTQLPDAFVVDTQTNVAAYASLTSAQQIYDALSLFATSNAGIVAGAVATRGFGTLTVTAGLTLDPAAAALIAVTGGVVTARCSLLSEDVTLISSGAIDVGAATLTTAVKLRAANLDSELVTVGVAGLTLYATLANAQTSTAPGASGAGGIVRFKHGSDLSGVVMLGSVVGAVDLGNAVQFQTISLSAGANLLDLSVAALVQRVSGQVAALAEPPTVQAIRAEMETAEGKLDRAMRYAKAARLQTL